MPTAHLHVHSSYSFGVGTASPETLCLAAARQGVDSLALTDLGGLYGIPDFLAAAHRHGIHPVVGASLPDPSMPRSLHSGRAVVLARETVVRNGPGDTFATAFVLHEGAEVVVEGERGSWTEISLPGELRGWIATDQIGRL